MLKIRKQRRGEPPITTLQLTSLMDIIILLLFYCLNFLNFTIFKEISSKVPIAETKEPPKDQKPLALNLKISSNEIAIYTGVPESLQKRFSKNSRGSFPFEAIHKYMIELKKKYPQENSAIFEPDEGISYEEIVKIMDSVRLLNNLDEAIFSKNQRVTELFNEIIFGNI